ncbi:spore germination protein [Jeotgalibacillus proteolyticus]|uniref:Spore gernimation protein GerPA n=1 Tax=Jeotgalibacillus proteolyticus TaxID=2082395 RepID=A0A2S5GHD5_9BACL|nr:spore germination protein [Jeotgalibacillus proteolyticus]PPA72368.1 spore gernimation protein GerPA [Jeotgalibacillus proteolyticus]
MPGIVGAIQIISIGSSAVLHVGDCFAVQPTSSTKTFAGAGSFNTGNGLFVENHQSATNTWDSDQFDQPTGGLF